ncbi:SDR family NAD(P)-dependent oxidoreductase, partial [Pseudomonas fluorescens]|nr:SDR family NAD(P)-dependent oxidoreductase [Pseudomonas fluorescens]
MMVDPVDFHGRDGRRANHVVGGFGLALVEQLAREQAHVVIVARDAERLAAAAAEMSRDTGRRVIACAGDMTRPDDIDRAMATAREAF